MKSATPSVTVSANSTDIPRILECKSGQCFDADE